MHVSEIMYIFAASESTTLPVEQRTRVELFLYVSYMKYNKQPLDISAQIAMLKGRGLNIADEQAAEKALNRQHGRPLNCSRSEL